LPRSTLLPYTTALPISLPSTAGLSGTVDSTAPFKAAQVSIRNVDKRILYLVYTNAGQFRAVNLFPGHYEIGVATSGLAADVQKRSEEHTSELQSPDHLV